MDPIEMFMLHFLLRKWLNDPVACSVMALDEDTMDKARDLEEELHDWVTANFTE